MIWLDVIVVELIVYFIINLNKDKFQIHVDIK